MFRDGDNVRKKLPKLFDRTEQTMANDVNIIKEWIMTQPHLPEVMENSKIGNFLLLNKYSIEKTKQKIDMYYSIRSLIPELYNDSNPNSPTMKNLMDTIFCFPHPKLVDELYRAFFIKVKGPNKLAPREVAMHCNNIAEVRLYEDCMVGDIIIFDLANISLHELTKITPTLLRKIIAMYEKVYSLRVKAVYLINSPLYIVNLLTILKSLLKAKIFSRIQVHQDTEVLNQVFAKDVLPKDYGGEGPTLQELNDLLKLKLAEYQDRFDELDKLKVNESLRPEKLDNDEVLGFYGNFKTLNVD